MTSRPRFATDVNYANGTAALALFGVLAWTFVNADFLPPLGFGEGEVTRSIGFAMFDMLELIPDGHGETEGFLVAFIVIAVVLDAALDGAVMLARREGEDESLVTALADGGRRLTTRERDGLDDSGPAADGGPDPAADSEEGED